MTGKSTESNVPPPSPASSISNSLPSPPFNDAADPDVSIVIPDAEKCQQPKAQTSGLKRNRASDAANIDIHFASLLENVKETTQALVNENKESYAAEENMLFLKSLAPILKRLPARENRIAKMRIQQLLFELEFGDA